MGPQESTHPTSTWRVLRLLLAAALVAAACTTDAPPDPAPGDEEPGAPSAAEIPSDVDLAQLEGTPVLAALAWVLDALADPPDHDALQATFTEGFQRELPVAQLRPVLVELGGAYRVTSLRNATATSLTAEIASDDHRWTLLLAVDPDAPQDPGIGTLFFADPLPDPATFEDWDEAGDALAGLAADVGFVAAQIDSGACVPLASARADDRAPIASIVKLAVLDAAAAAVESGEASWDDPLTVTDALRSLPTGVLQDAPEGTEVTLAEAAELAGVVSDNTAADLLADLVGRDAVADARERLGMPAHADELPLLSTRELFQLVWDIDDATRTAYLDADVDGRLELLAALPDTPLTLTPADLVATPDLRALGWSATPAELCDALVAMGARADADPVVAAAVGTNAIVRLDATPWEPVVAKGGSAPGVLAFAWLVQDEDGQRAALVVTLADDQPIDELAALPVVEGALALLAER